MTREKVAASWRHYLGPNPDTAPISPYAAPARATDLSGLPTAHIATAQFDPNRDEAIDYALRLLQADVPVDLHQWARAPSTGHRRRYPPRCPGDRSTSSPQSCTEPWSEGDGRGPGTNVHRGKETPT
ncbi:hypothetical protein GCM10020000_81670 [Streptomyces olivoverticillatus]